MLNFAAEEALKHSWVTHRTDGYAADTETVEKTCLQKDMQREDFPWTRKTAQLSSFNEGDLNLLYLL